MFKRLRPPVALLAGLVMVFATACGSSTATGGSAGSSGPGSSGPGSGGSGSNSTPSPVITATPLTADSVLGTAIAGGPDIKSLHIKIALSGTITAAGLASLAPNSDLHLTKDITLDGTAIEGDVDVANQAAHLALTVPAMEMTGNAPITGDLIVVNKILYYKVGLLGTKYHQTSLSDLASSLPVSLPSSLPTSTASGLTGLADEVSALRAQLQEAGFSASIVGIDQIDGVPATHIAITVPIDRLNADLTAKASPSPAPLQISSGSIDLWIYVADHHLARLEMKGAAAGGGNLDLVITVSAYDAPVTIVAPPAAQLYTP
jgi:hypothetical protein